MVMGVFCDIFPEHLRGLVARIPVDHVYELRMRVNQPITVCMSGGVFFLHERGLSTNSDGAVVVSRTDLDAIVHRASSHSIYAFNDQLRQGFITIRGGVRIGICGTVVSEKGAVLTVKNVQSLNIRIPHQVRGCSYSALAHVFSDDNRVRSTLIVAPPGAGKTTFLRDLACQVGKHFPAQNVLVVDERGELAANHLGENQLDVGHCADVISGCTKAYGFECGVRSMRPDVIITDEIATAEDIAMVSLACRSGVAVLASVHAGGIDEIRLKPGFREMVDNQVFDRYVVLGVRDKPGCVVAVYDKNLKTLA